MKRRFLKLLQFIFLCSSSFAAKSLDETLNIVASDIVEKCDADSILVIDDFESPAEEMTFYIREQIADLIYHEDGLVQIVTRDRMDIIEKELIFQNSGIVSERTIVSVAERLGAKSIVFGKFEELNGGYILRVRMLDVEKALYLFRKSYEISRSSKTEQLLGRASVWHKASIGNILEINKNSLEFISPSIGIVFNYGLTRNFSVGVNFITSFDLYEKNNSVLTVESLLTSRFYLVSPTGEPLSGLFLEAMGGVSFLFINSELDNAANAGGVIGFRFVLNKIYVEPVLRAGYPYLFGAGVGAGIRF